MVVMCFNLHYCMKLWAMKIDFIYVYVALLTECVCNAFYAKWIQLVTENKHFTNLSLIVIKNRNSREYHKMFTFSDDVIEDIPECQKNMDLRECKLDGR